ncbi:RimJ/RimL family protein N-acetyltransferase [Shimia isoporae]|uniref:RimJ/RimL family protein N-acetyltransferase n=1 Tax=Shimia isoporae TaxID=647720 RepID=A0A4R1NKP8_9RHOB|nr:GNAT family N-acetyltransferase [Shimia isoporae]TCL08229.1 RimJ/RimL family protein N-acetyltransferase [Shimia isoporae]
MITTARLTLRRARADDLEDMYRVFSNPDAMRYWDTLPHTDVSQTEDFLQRMIAAPEDASDDFIIERDGRAIGKGGCWRIAEVGFILHPDHWRQGIGFEALSAAIPHAFETLPIDHLTAEADPRNTGSLTLLNRLGFVETGRESNTIKVGDEWCDSVYLRLERPD